VSNLSSLRNDDAGARSIDGGSFCHAGGDLGRRRGYELSCSLGRIPLPLVDRLEQIYAAIDRAHPQNLFLIIYLAGRPQDYVQCVFDPRTRMLCEASSGYYDSKPNEPRAYRLPASSVAALGRLGFSTDDSAGNFQIRLNVAEPPDLNRIADFALKALHDGYGARAGGKLEFNAPLAPRASSQCMPVG
jgi:hypothetical protein